ncbi:unnamed protein product [Larinioides sclopetarius]|uniref:Uncharacterized protein n=1 Tax=Larinioides sclopetarius TaxID=280406 RepID=A0AAV1YZU5_9ARAC
MLIFTDHKFSNYIDQFFSPFQCRISFDFFYATKQFLVSFNRCNYNGDRRYPPRNFSQTLEIGSKTRKEKNCTEENVTMARLRQNFLVI